MRPIDRLAVRLRARGGQLRERDVLRIAEEVCWEHPFGATSRELDETLRRFVETLDDAQASALKARVWRALPPEERALCLEAIWDEFNTETFGGVA